jgi:SAM-dependent methyltransferase
MTATRPQRIHGSDINLHSAPQMAEYRAAAARVARDGHRTVLDWGCGYGQMSDLLRRAGLAVEAIDYDPAAAGEERRPLARFPGLEATYTSDPVRLPYGDGAFDAVLSMGVLEHVRDPDRSLRELARVLRPGGVLYVFKLPNRYSWLEAIARRTGQYFHGQLPDDRLYTVASARRLLERHGFDVAEIRRANMLPLTLPGRLATRAAPAIWAANRALARVPGLNLAATNVELVARPPRAGGRLPSAPMSVDQVLRDAPSLHGDLTYGLTPEALRFIERTVRPGDHTLETGAGYSTISFAATGARHDCIVPDQEQVARIRAYCVRAGISTENVRFHVAPSERVLPTLALDTLDLVLIDGSHSFPQVFIDWFYVADALRVGGTLMIDDVHLWTGSTLRDFLLDEPEWEKVTELTGRTTVFRKVGETDPDKLWLDQRYVRRKSRLGLPSQARSAVSMLRHGQTRALRREVGRRLRRR